MNKKVFPVLPFVLVSLVLGLLTGLLRMGWIIPVGQVMGDHGAIMTGSFLGTLILLERVVTFKKRWLYALPVCSGMSVLFFLVDLHPVAFICLAVGAAGLIYLYILLIRPFHGSLYIWAILLQVSTAGRVVGDLWPSPDVRRFSGMVAGIVIAFYLVNLFIVLVIQYRAGQAHRSHIQGRI